ncbi:MAG: hypothetical protein CSA18_04075 [Deltaproteobacteria bacterium]|nr:MAG: hypothetical protein CSA18_04075 [Deltaproteobacteria bacterium]
MNNFLGTIIVFLIIGFCAFYVIRKIYLTLKNDDISESGCGGGCGGGCSAGSDNSQCSINEFYAEENDEKKE